VSNVNSLILAIWLLLLNLFITVKRNILC